ncbi:hypothetical protein MJG53_006808 [Ovis ammon polii x Ovis aries]|uniref:Uncharacterized protein n=1 Tax=Ovis ammon polii x Ovis aries TaxID=2918886 RepID=A0ACB9V5R8_9CETA|nr:hypothetical protein MJG53_006808 [Ovis ammon polii x Ovis aries]
MCIREPRDCLGSTQVPPSSTWKRDSSEVIPPLQKFSLKDGTPLDNSHPDALSKGRAEKLHLLYLPAFLWLLALRSETEAHCLQRCLVTGMPGKQTGSIRGGVPVNRRVPDKEVTQRADNFPITQVLREGTLSQRNYESRFLKAIFQDSSEGQDHMRGSLHHHLSMKASADKGSFSNTQNTDLTDVGKFEAKRLVSERIPRTKEVLCTTQGFSCCLENTEMEKGKQKPMQHHVLFSPKEKSPGTASTNKLATMIERWSQPTKHRVPASKVF